MIPATSSLITDSPQLQATLLGDPTDPRTTLKRLTFFFDFLCASQGLPNLAQSISHPIHYLEPNSEFFTFTLNLAQLT